VKTRETLKIIYYVCSGVFHISLAYRYFSVAETMPQRRQGLSLYKYRRSAMVSNQLIPVIYGFLQVPLQVARAKNHILIHDLVNSQVQWLAKHYSTRELKKMRQGQRILSPSSSEFSRPVRDLRVLFPILASFAGNKVVYGIAIRR